MYLMNESRVKDIWTVLIVIFSTHECSQSLENHSLTKQEEKKLTTISSFDDMIFERALTLVLPLYKEMFLSFPKHSLPEGLKNYQQIHYCNIL